MQDKIFGMGIVVLVVIVVATIAAVPTIWSLNVIFGTMIPFTPKTIFATALLMSIVHQTSK